MDLTEPCASLPWCIHTVSTMDSHPFCVVCMGLKCVEEAIDFPNNCSHLLALSKKLQCQRVQLAATQILDFGQSDSDGRNGYDGVLPGISRGVASLSWADESIPSLLEGILPGELSFINEPPGSCNKDNAGLLEGLEDD